MKDKQTDELNLNSEQGSAFASRRTIIKGLASTVPVVMTIGCGKALANSSSHQCIVNTAQPPSELECITGTDNWKRVETVTKVKGEDVTQQCLIYVDEQGAPVGNGHTNKKWAITASCYSSFI